MQSAGLVVRSGERGMPTWTTAVVNVRVDDHPEPLAELRRLVELSLAYRDTYLALEGLADTSPTAAVEAARKLSSRAIADPNARVLLGLSLARASNPEGREVLVAMAEQCDKWLPYVRALCLRYGIEPQSILVDAPHRASPPPVLPS